MTGCKYMVCPALVRGTLMPVSLTRINPFVEVPSKSLSMERSESDQNPYMLPIGHSANQRTKPFLELGVGVCEGEVSDPFEKPGVTLDSSHSFGG